MNTRDCAMTHRSEHSYPFRQAERTFPMIYTEVIGLKGHGSWCAGTTRIVLCCILEIPVQQQVSTSIFCSAVNFVLVANILASLSKYIMSVNRMIS
jgi:hypothetical protein